MSPCSCGQAVRLRAMRVSLGRRRGVAHWIEHEDSSPACNGPWQCAALKPYVKDETQREYAKLKRRWEETGCWEANGSPPVR